MWSLMVMLAPPEPLARGALAPGARPAIRVTGEPRLTWRGACSGSGQPTLAGDPPNRLRSCFNDAPERVVRQPEGPPVSGSRERLEPAVARRLPARRGRAVLDRSIRVGTPIDLASHPARPARRAARDLGSAPEGLTTWHR